jgi:predicted Zn finger-like uncharacterized protein
MIIQCRKCETRFRFNDALIEGDGVWVRCSRCQEVFFQDRPLSEPLPAAAVQPEIPSVRISDARRIADDRFDLADEQPPRVEKESADLLPPLPFETASETSTEIEKDATVEGIGTDLDREPLGPTANGEEEAAEEEEQGGGGEPGRGRWFRTILKAFAVLIFIFLVAGGVYLWLFPEAQTRVLESVSPWLRGIPGIERLLGTETKSHETAAVPVRLKDVRQRSMANLLMGNLSVIEGVAVNQSSSSLAKIRVRLVISDAYDVVLGEKLAYCGNILTDAELNTLAEAEIQRELSIPQGSDISNEKVAPNGEIPFMIVFSQAQAGTIKMVVMPAGAERIP